MGIFFYVFGFVVVGCCVVFVFFVFFGFVVCLWLCCWGVCMLCFSLCGVFVGLCMCGVVKLDICEFGYSV